MYAFYNMNVTNATLFPGLDGMARSLAYELEFHWAYDPKTMAIPGILTGEDQYGWSEGGVEAPSNPTLQRTRPQSAASRWRTIRLSFLNPQQKSCYCASLTPVSDPTASRQPCNERDGGADGYN
jgi:hypothetical protein